MSATWLGPNPAGAAAARVSGSRPPVASPLATHNRPPTAWRRRTVAKGTNQAAAAARDQIPTHTSTRFGPFFGQGEGGRIVDRVEPDGGWMDGRAARGAGAFQVGGPPRFCPLARASVRAPRCPGFPRRPGEEIKKRDRQWRRTKKNRGMARLNCQKIKIQVKSSM